MSNFEHRITEDSTEFEKAFLKIYDGSLWNALDKMKDWQPPKPLDIIPEFVEKWYNDNILYGTFSGVIASYAFNDNLDSVKWVNRNGGMELLCKMYLYGYTVVEKEKLYILKFPSQLYPYVSEVSVDNGITKQSKFAGSALKLTEKGIKAIDERYWQFAVMVDH